jgi:hypothetical protein
VESSHLIIERKTVEYLILVTGLGRN